MIDLFRPAMNYPLAMEYLLDVLKPKPDGRVYCGEGAVTARFEERIADLLNLPARTDREPRILAVNSCTMALTIALDCVGAGPGDEIISSPITCTATSGAIVKSGATIVWSDVDRTTGNIDPADVARKITSRTKAIIAVDWGGRLCDYPRLRQLGLPVIEDAAHAFLAESRFERGDYVCYSFGPIKHLTAGGYGGALITPPEKSRFARLARWHGLDRQSSADFRCAQDIVDAGYRGHMTDDQAAIGLANAERVEWVVARHRENAAWYDRVLRYLDGITAPPADPGSAYWLYTLLVPVDRDALQAHLAASGVASSPVHAINTRHAAFARQSRGADSVPNADWFDRSQLSIPVGWFISPEDRDKVAASVISFALTPVPA